MADTLTTDVSFALRWSFVAGLNLGNVIDSNRLSYSETLANGSGSSQAQKVWHDERTLAAGATETLDLNALTNSAFGGTVTVNFSTVKFLAIVVTTASTGYLQIGGAASNEWYAPFAAAGDKVKVGPDSLLVLSEKVSGWTVTNGSADSLKIDNPSAVSVTYRIVIVGT